MTLRQSVLKIMYPLVMKFSNSGNMGKILTNTESVNPLQSFYELHAIQNNGDEINFAAFRGKKVLIVNTASDCGYTDQYEELQKLHELQKDKLVVIGFPANDFKEQEKGNDEDIATFCKVNYGVTFLLTIKSSVIKGTQQNPLFQWLTGKNKNGWNNQQPAWNFSKYLIDENGVLIKYFGPSVSPLSDEVIAAIKK